MKAIFQGNRIVGIEVRGKDIRVRKSPSPPQLYQIDWDYDGVPQTYKAGRNKIRQFLANLQYAALTDYRISNIRLFKVISHDGKTRLEIIEGGRL